MTETEEFDVAIDGYFAIIPEWVVYAEVSDRAFRLYAVLRRHANNKLMSRPSRAKLAERLRTSVKSIDRALRELETVGAVTIRHRWSNPQGTEYVFRKDVDHPIPAPSGYLLHNSPALVNSEGGRDTGDATPRDTGDRRGRDTGDARTRALRTRGKRLFGAFGFTHTRTGAEEGSEASRHPSP